MERKDFIIYRALSETTGKSYIGLTGRELKVRKKEHQYNAERGCPFHFHKAIRKYGFVDFSWTVLKSFIGTSSEALQFERSFIDEYEAFEKGYNLNICGGGRTCGWKHTLEAKAKMRSKKLTEEHKQKIREALTGKIFSEEHLANLSKAQHGKYFSQKTKNKLSEAQKLRAHWPVRGDVFTPFGRFTSAKVVTALCGKTLKTIYNRCDSSKSRWRSWHFQKPHCNV